MSARLVRSPADQEFFLHCAYRPEFVVELKQMILATRSRRWDEQEGRWVISDLYEEKVIQLCVVHFGGCHVYGADGELDLVVDRTGRAIQERLL